MLKTVIDRCTKNWLDTIVWMEDLHTFDWTDSHRKMAWTLWKTKQNVNSINSNWNKCSNERTRPKKHSKEWEYRSKKIVAKSNDSINSKRRSLLRERQLWRNIQVVVNLQIDSEWHYKTVSFEIKAPKTENFPFDSNCLTVHRFYCSVTKLYEKFKFVEKFYNHKTIRYVFNKNSLFFFLTFEIIHAIGYVN